MKGRNVDGIEYHAMFETITLKYISQSRIIFKFYGFGLLLLHNPARYIFGKIRT